MHSSAGEIDKVKPYYQQGGGATPTNLLRYPGGKSRLLGSLQKHIARGDMFGPSWYVEPFVGGGAVLRHVLDVGNFPNLLINDIDKELMALWRSVRDSPERLMSVVTSWIPNVDDWYMFKSLDDSATASDTDDTTRGFRKLALHFCSHGGLGVMAGGPQGGREQKSEYKVDCRWNTTRMARTIVWFSKRIQGAVITSRDFSELKFPASDAFVFCDPPYVEAGPALYKHAFDSDMHANLRRFLLGCVDWAVTYDDAALVHELYDGCTIFKYDNDTGNNSKKIELLITPR